MHTLLLIATAIFSYSYTATAHQSEKRFWPFTSGTFSLQALHEINQAHNDILNHTAVVRIDTGKPNLSIQEQRFLTARDAYVLQAQRKFFNMPHLHKPLRIAVCGSGGGFRAMIGFLGALEGLEKIGLLDCVTYVAGLSGSTWAMASWFTHKKNIKGTNDIIKDRVNRRLFRKALRGTLQDILFLGVYFVYQYLSRGVISIIDIYGYILHNALFEDIKGEHITRHTLSDQASDIVDGSKPMPLYAAIIEHPLSKNQYAWCEMNPFEATCLESRCSIPITSLSSTFYQGSLHKARPEPSLAKITAICGSAFSVNLQDIQRIEEEAGSSLSTIGKFIANKTSFGTTRFLPARIHNFMKGLPNSPFCGETYLTFLDAGILCNIPLALLTENPAREVDIILVVDLSSNAEGAPELKKALEHSATQGFNVPEISQTAGFEPYTLLPGSKETKTPSIIYLPRVANPRYSSFYDPADFMQGYLNTFNFNYSVEQYDNFSWLMRYSAQSCRDIVKEAAQAHFTTDL